MREAVNGQAVIVPERAQPLAHYPHLRVAGGFIFVSGISARRPDGSIEGDEVETQTQAVLENIRVLLRAVNADLEHLVDVTVFLRHMQDYAAFNGVYNRYFNAETGPTRTTVEVSALPGPDLLIEIKAIALAP
ncbi:MAG: RidA family protein [Candidatus Xenobia bacterium]